MKILLIGNGGREHALAWKINQSLQLKKLYIATGNAGTASIGENIEIEPTDFEQLATFSIENQIDLIVVGPEEPLVKGIVDYFAGDENTKNIPVIGPDTKGARLEGSKEYAKQFMCKYNIPTARHQSFKYHQFTEGVAFLKTLNPPFVIKADGLAAGKGVIITENLNVAISSLKELLEGKFGDASTTVVIEEFLRGTELSVFVVTDGIDYKILPEAKDYKRIHENDKGENTGGMGAVSPVYFADEKFMKKIEKQIIIPTINGLKQENINYKGFIFFGLINVDNNPYVIEYNARLGDPETEVILPRIKTDIIEIFKAISNQSLSELNLEIDENYATTVMMVSGGYPGDYSKGKIIKGLNNTNDCFVFQAGTKLSDNKILTNGGRVLAVTAMGNNLNSALEKSYRNIKRLYFDNCNYRKDIGFDLK